MAQLSTIIGSILRDMVYAQHQANMYASTLEEAYRKSGRLEQFAMPAIALGEMELTVRYGITETDKETEQFEVNYPVLRDNIRHICRAGAKLLIRSALPILKTILKNTPKIGDVHIGELDSNPELRRKFSAFLSHKIYIAIQNDPLAITNDDGTINDKVGMYVGMDRFDCRKQIEKDLQDADLLEKTEAYTNNVGYSERTGVAIEPKLSMQWFMSMKEIAEPATKAVLEDIIRFVPEKYKNTYRHWMENIKDWCISRQLWWGQRIPAYYLPKGGYVVAETAEKALALAQEKTGDNTLTLADLRQDDDVLDTWFSSWLWPISVFDGIRNPDNEQIKYYYPTNDLVTGPDIIFFWVARMIMAGNEFMNDVPFRNVYLTGIVRDKLGRKMSKTLGNSPDPLDLIAKYGADAVRLGMLLCSSAGNDILYDESQIEQGRNFNNKVWNAFRLVTGWNVDEAAQQPDASAVAVKWFDSKLSQVIETVEDHFGKFRISDALMTIYKFFWDDFCAWYLEAVKPAYGAGIDRKTYEATLGFFDSLLKMIHPIMPFITEELWQNMAERKEGETIMNQRYPQAKEYDQEFITAFDMACEAVAGVRNIRQSKNLSPRESLDLLVKGDFPEEVLPVIVKLANVNVAKAEGDLSAAQRFMVRTVEMFVPLTGLINVEEEIAKLEAELAYQQKFLDSVRKKLSNERFVANAPEAVVAVERKKEADSLSKIESITTSLNALKNN